jgi:hypothetical protein
VKKRKAKPGEVCMKKRNGKSEKKENLEKKKERKI